MSIIRRGYTLIELLVVISIISLLIALILPALRSARDAAQIAQCASRQHQLLIALHLYGVDQESKLPPGSGYASYAHTPHRALRGSGDFFDVLVPEYIAPWREIFYCPASLIIPDEPLNDGTFGDFWGGHIYGIINVYCNLVEKGLYTDIPRQLDDPGNWILSIDGTYFNSDGDNWILGNHPGFAANWGKTPYVYGRNSPSGPRGTNAGQLDGAVIWTPQLECVLGYPGGGGSMSYTSVRILEPPSPGRPGIIQ